MNLNLIWVPFFVIVLALMWLTTRPQKIVRPRLGFLDLTSGKSDNLLSEDRAALNGLFSSVEVSSTAVPQCDILLLYATLGESGNLTENGGSLRAAIRESGAKIVIVASENPKVQPFKRPSHEAKANLVITLQRNGANFPKFFRDLFSRMKKGQTMPSAWVSLAPQNPNSIQTDAPSTIFLMELGPIRLA